MEEQKDVSEEPEKPRILLVDDSKVVRMSAEKILGEDFDLVTAFDGQDAWEKLTSDDTIQALFTDLGMPYIDGYELLAKVRQSDDANLAAMPVVIVTGNEGEEAREDALKRGATDFIPKPFNKVDLLARARSHASYGRKTRELSQQARELEEHTTIDPVTRLGNQQFFADKLKKDRAFARRHYESISLVIVDLGGFEAVVSDHGKKGAASILRRVGDIVPEHVREEDTAARISTAQFAIVSPTCDAGGARALAERLHKALVEAGLKVGDEAVNLTVGVGVYTPALGDDQPLKKWLETARKAALAAGKKGGGVVAESDEEEQAATPEPSEPAPGLEEALKMVEQGQKDKVLPHVATLLEQVLPLFSVADMRQKKAFLNELRKYFGNN